MKKDSIVYLAVGCDKYELPIAVFSELSEVAKYAGTTLSHAGYMIGKNTVNRKCNCKFIKVDTEKV